MTSLREDTKRDFDWLDRAAIAYLALPVLIFLCGWLQWWAGLPLAGLLLVACRSLLPAGAAQPLKIRWGVGLFVTAVAVGWSILGGAGHLFYANFDWVTRDAVLRDLVVGGWPVGYGEEDGAQLMLRAPLGFYLPAALVGKVFGLAWADPALLVWTALGAALFLGLAVSRCSTWTAVGIVVAVLVLFGGMDLLGTVLRGGFFLASNLRLTDHVEWWADRFQYSSHTTQLFWVPNHSLAGWIATALLIKNLDRPQFVGMLPLVVTLIPLWSPLTAIGFLPLAAWWWLRQLVTQRSLRSIDAVALGAAVAIAFVTGAYLVLGAGEIASGATARTGESMLFFVPHYLQFVLLEGGILWMLLLAVRADGLLVVADLILWLLPLAAFGPSNDLAMRASIPALVVLAMAAAAAIANPARAIERRVFWPILAILLLGVPTAVMESTRAISEPVWKPDLAKNLVESSGNTRPVHYIARLDQSLVVGLLKPVQPLSALDFTKRSYADSSENKP